MVDMLKGENFTEKGLTGAPLAATLTRYIDLEID